MNELFILPRTVHLWRESMCPTGLLQLPEWGLMDVCQTLWEDGSDGGDGGARGYNAMLLTYPFPEHSAPKLPWGMQEA